MLRYRFTNYFLRAQTYFKKERKENGLHIVENEQDTTNYSVFVQKGGEEYFPTLQKVYENSVKVVITHRGFINLPLISRDIWEMNPVSVSARWVGLPNGLSTRSPT